MSRYKINIRSGMNGNKAAEALIRVKWDDRWQMAFSFRCDGNKYESLELGMYISSCTEIEQKKKYRMPIILLVTQILRAWTVRQSLNVTADKIGG
jgi:hypothetical protein